MVVGKICCAPSALLAGGVFASYQREIGKPANQKGGEGNLKREEKREQAIRFLREKERLLGRCPKRSDFSGADAGWIKQILGPWPRALEAAGLKEAPSRGKSHPRRAQQPFAQKTEEPNDGKEAETK